MNKPFAPLTIGSVWASNHRSDIKYGVMQARVLTGVTDTHAIFGLHKRVGRVKRNTKGVVGHRLVREKTTPGAWS